MTKAVAVADLELGTVLARVDIAVPPERVFRALTTSELTKWWGSDELYRTTGFAIDLRVGGAWRSEGVGRDGSAFHVEGEIVKLDPPRELVQTWKPSWEQGFFFGKLVPPRPTFPQDMTADEGALMAKHADYLKIKIASGDVLLAGPVGDPSGAYGIVVARVRDEAELHALVAGDPVIAANAGFRYDTFPMLGLLGS